MIRDLFVGIDLGTTGVVVGVFDRQGTPQGLAEITYDVAPRGGTLHTAVEQDPTIWWDATCAAVRRATSGCNPERLAAICAAGQGPSLVAVNAQFQPVTLSPIWMDTRAETIAAELAQKSGSSGDGLTLVAKALWLEEHRPAEAARIVYYLQAWDYIAARLCHKAFVSSTWDSAAISAAGLPEQRFPPYIPCGQSAGTLSQEAAEATGLPPGLPVTAGTNDSIIGLIGCGATARGRGSALGGTSGGFAVAWDELPGAWRPPPGTYPEPPGLQYFGAATAASGRILDWCLAATAGPLPHHATRDWEAEAALVPPGCDGLILLPYLAGERAPFRDPQARGVFFGLGLHHTSAHLLRAALEGVAFSVRHVMESTIALGAHTDDVRVFGGQARSSLWNQMKANVVNRPLLVPEVIEASALGAAIVAAASTGAYPTIWDAADAMTHIARRIDPDPRSVEVYDRAFAIYRDLYPRLHDMFPALLTLSGDPRDAADDPPED